MAEFGDGTAVPGHAAVVVPGAGSNAGVPDNPTRIPRKPFPEDGGGEAGHGGASASFAKSTPASDRIQYPCKSNHYNHLNALLILAFGFSGFVSKR